MSAQHRLVIPDSSGHTELAFDPGDPTVVNGILARFVLETGKPGKRAFAAEKDGDTLVPVDNFDPNRFEHVVLSSFQGG
jgi:hypothetical protein